MLPEIQSFSSAGLVSAGLSCGIYDFETLTGRDCEACKRVSGTGLHTQFGNERRGGGMPFPLRDDADSTYGFARDAAIWRRRIPLCGNDGRRFRHFPKKRDDGHHESGFEYETGERCTANRGYPGARDSDGHRNGWSGKQ